MPPSTSKDTKIAEKVASATPGSRSANKVTAWVDSISRAAPLRANDTTISGTPAPFYGSRSGSHLPPPDATASKTSLDSYVFDRPPSLVPILDTIFSFDALRASMFFPQSELPTSPTRKTLSTDTPSAAVDTPASAPVDADSKSMLAYLDSRSQEEITSSLVATASELYPSSSSFNVFDRQCLEPKASLIPSRDSSGSVSDGSQDWFASKFSDDSDASIYDTASNFSFGMAGDLLLEMRDRNTTFLERQSGGKWNHAVVVPPVLNNAPAPKLTTVPTSTISRSGSAKSIPSAGSATLAELLAAANADTDENILDAQTAPCFPVSSLASFTSGNHQHTRNPSDSRLSVTVSQILRCTSEKLLTLEAPLLSGGDSFADGIPDSDSLPGIKLDFVRGGAAGRTSRASAYKTFIPSCLPSIDNLDGANSPGSTDGSVELPLSPIEGDDIDRAPSPVLITSASSGTLEPPLHIATTNSTIGIPVLEPDHILHRSAEDGHSPTCAIQEDADSHSISDRSSRASVYSASDYSSLGIEVLRDNFANPEPPLSISAAIARELRSLDGFSQFRWVDGTLYRPSQDYMGIEDVFAFDDTESDGSDGTGGEETSLIEALKALPEPTNFSLGMAGDFMIREEEALEEVMEAPRLPSNMLIDLPEIPDVSSWEESLGGHFLRGSGSLSTIAEEDSADLESA